MRTTLMVAAAAVTMIAMPASAASVATELGSDAAFTAPAGTVIDFNTGLLPTGFLASYTNAAIVQDDLVNQYAEPAFSDGSRYLAVFAGGTASLTSALEFASVSFFIGSIDTFNTVDLLDASGGVIQSFTGSSFVVPANGDQSTPSTNRRVTLTASATDARISGIRFNSGFNALEVDNVVFAVPEPTTWALMLVGFGMVGAATRYRRRKTALSFA